MAPSQRPVAVPTLESMRQIRGFLKGGQMEDGSPLVESRSSHSKAEVK